MQDKIWLCLFVFWMQIYAVHAVASTVTSPYLKILAQPKEAVLAKSFANIPRVQCMFQCAMVGGCLSFSHNAVSRACEIFTGGSTSNTSAGSMGTDWAHYIIEIASPTCSDRDCGITLTRFGNRERVFAVCDNSWLVIQNHESSADPVDFDLPYKDYTYGFGQVTGNFWLGLEKMHVLTSSRPYKLRVEMTQRTTGNVFYQEYATFQVGSAVDGYNLTVSGSSGTAGDGLSNSVGVKFSTYDNDQDLANVTNCAALNKGGWWFTTCFNATHGANLNGPTDVPACRGQTRSICALWRALETAYPYLGLTQTRMMMK